MNNNLYREFKNKEGTIEYHLMGLDFEEDFDRVSALLTEKFGAKVIDQLEGFSSRIWTFEKEGVVFKFVYYSELGNYCYALEQTNEAQELLRQLLCDVLPVLG